MVICVTSLFGLLEFKGVGIFMNVSGSNFLTLGMYMMMNKVHSLVGYGGHEGRNVLISLTFLPFEIIFKFYGHWSK